MKLRLSLVLIGLLVCVMPLSAAGTVVVTSTVGSNGTAVYAIAWTSTAGGAVSGNAFGVRGLLLQVKFVPNTGATQPTDQYDVTLVDQDGADVLTVGGTSYGSNLSNATPLLLTYEQPVILSAAGTLDLVVANAGNAKTGTVYVWVQRQ